MMIRSCDRCGRPIEPNQLRYVAKIQVFAAYDPLSITFEDLARDHTLEIQCLLEQCDELTEEELMREVYVERQFDLCPPCQKAFLADPLSKPANGVDQTINPEH
ncbi:MAG: hypothetical protein M1608_06865 [Candidatus Omnitrophica bacterium]|nr:hypothetical protein [Candidatus Omnitrophota bacterium]